MLAFWTARAKSFCYVVVAEGEDAIGRVIDRKSRRPFKHESRNGKAMPRNASGWAQVKANLQIPQLQESRRG